MGKERKKSDVAHFTASVGREGYRTWIFAAWAKSHVFWCFGDWLSSHHAATRQLHTGLVGKQKKEQGLNPPALTPASPGLCLRPVLAVQEEEQGWRLQSSGADLLGLLPSLFLP